MKTFDPIQAEQIMGRAFKATVRQKFIFRFHRRLLYRFWAAMKRNIEWSSDHMDEDDDLGDMTLRSDSVPVGRDWHC